MIRIINDDFDLEALCSPVNCNECGDLVSSLAADPVYSGGHICAECLAQNIGIVLKCDFCSVVLNPEDLIDMVHCPDCGNVVEIKD